MILIKIRNYIESDYKELKDMIISLYAEDPEGEKINTFKIDKTIQTLTKHPDKGEIIIFEKDMNIIGYSLIIFYWSNEYGGDLISIDELYIKQNFRGLNYSLIFMNYIFNKYKNSNIILEVTPSNKKAYEYYKKLGFKETQNKHMIKNNNII